MGATKIEWCDKTWNPVIGCGKASAGCDNCYAERMARRLKGKGVYGYKTVIGANGRWTNLSVLLEDRLNEPLNWKCPSRIFVTSMGDIFVHDALNKIDHVFDVIRKCQRLNTGHTFIILTKRPALGEKYFGMRPDKHLRWRNLWTGVTVEDKSQIYRAFTLPALPGEVHFLSCEPLLGPVDISNCIEKIDWVICGAETGPGARPMDPDWARSLRDQCRDAGVPFFLKSLTGVKTKSGELPKLDGQAWGEFPK